MVPVFAELITLWGKEIVSQLTSTCCGLIIGIGAAGVGGAFTLTGWRLPEDQAGMSAMVRAERLQKGHRQ